VVLFLSDTPFRRATALLYKYCFFLLLFLVLYLDKHGSISFCLAYSEKKIFGQVEQRGKTDLSHAKHGPFRNLLPFYDNLDTLDKML